MLRCEGKVTKCLGRLCLRGPVEEEKFTNLLVNFLRISGSWKVLASIWESPVTPATSRIALRRLWVSDSILLSSWASGKLKSGDNAGSVAMSIGLGGRSSSSLSFWLSFLWLVWTGRLVSAFFGLSILETGPLAVAYTSILARRDDLVDILDLHHVEQGGCHVRPLDEAQFYMGSFCTHHKFSILKTIEADCTFLWSLQSSSNLWVLTLLLTLLAGRFNWLWEILCNYYVNGHEIYSTHTHIHTHTHTLPPVDYDINYVNFKVKIKWISSTVHVDLHVLNCIWPWE